jgi:hypothetical protein
MTAQAVMEVAGPVALAGSADEHALASQRDTLLADATAHLLFAYEAIDAYAQSSAKPWSTCAFVNTCRFLCATLSAIDEFSESVWTDA